MCVCVHVHTFRLDEARAVRFMRRQPKRIILIRHAESIGNVDSSVYTDTPDNKLPITQLGKEQAYVSYSWCVVEVCLDGVPL